MMTKSFLLSIIMTASMTMGLSQSVLAQDADAVLQALDDALPGDLIHNPLNLNWETRGNGLKAKIVDAEALPNGKAINVKIKKRQDRPWDAVLYTNIEGSIQKGERIQAHFWVRTDKPATGKETADFTLFIGRNEEPYDSIIAEQIIPGSDWKLLKVSGVAVSNIPEGELKVEYQLGKSKQTVEIGAIYVSTLGAVTP